MVLHEKSIPNLPIYRRMDDVVVKPTYTYFSIADFREKSIATEKVVDFSEKWSVDACER